MEIEFDFDKRDKTLKERGLDFSRAVEVFAGVHFTGQDTRSEYAEDRFITVGTMNLNPAVTPSSASPMSALAVR